MENGKRARIITIANEKGGVGKTAMTLNLGAALSQARKQVLVVDVDPQANATKGLGIEVGRGRSTIYDLMTGDNIHSAKDAIVKTQWSGLHLIPSHVDLAGAEVELVDVAGRENRLKESLEGIDCLYDFILLDTPPSLSLLTINVFSYAKEVLIPCQTHPYSYEALDELFDTIEAIQAEINPKLQITGVVATFFDRRTRVSHAIVDKLRSELRYQNLLFSTMIRTNTTIAESAAVGKPITFYRRNSFGAIDFMNLAEELLKRD